MVRIHHGQFVDWTVTSRLRPGLTKPASIGNPQLADLLRREFTKLMSDLSDFERVKRFILIAQPFSPEIGLVIPTLKLLRREIAERFADEIEDLYADSPQQAISV